VDAWLSPNRGRTSRTPLSWREVIDVRKLREEYRVHRREAGLCASIRCLCGQEIQSALLLAQQARRRAEVKKPQKAPRPAKNPGHATASVKRAVWSRDEGKCTWPLDSGGICGSTLRLEVDHVVPRGRDGPSTIDNCRLACKFHNQLAARQVSGDDWMDQFTSGAARNVPVARAGSG
jgi:5-methylcytosine-specific restriction endonuclease McrA